MRLNLQKCESITNDFHKNSIKVSNSCMTTVMNISVFPEHRTEDQLLILKPQKKTDGLKLHVSKTALMRVLVQLAEQVSRQAQNNISVNI